MCLLLSAVTASAETLEHALFEAKRVLVGQDRMIERLFVSWLANGHCLIEGSPGLAKTLAAETIPVAVSTSPARMSVSCRKSVRSITPRA